MITQIILIIFILYFIHLSSAWLHLNTLSPSYKKVDITESSIIKKTCLLKPAMGPCRAGIPMYYFDPETKKCSNFVWGGCQGNGNRYKTEEECNETCLSAPDWKPGRPRYCSLNFDYGFCFGGEQRYYYDKFSKVCKQTIYSGCGGNKNNFYSKEQCHQICTLGNNPIKELLNKRKKVKKILIVNPSRDHTTKKRKHDITHSVVNITTEHTDDIHTTTTKPATTAHTPIPKKH